jgi:hypothetical protein
VYKNLSRPYLSDLHQACQYSLLLSRERRQRSDLLEDPLRPNHNESLPVDHECNGWPRRSDRGIGRLRTEQSALAHTAPCTKRSHGLLRAVWLGDDNAYLAFMDREKPQAERPLLDQHTPRREAFPTNAHRDLALRCWS